MNSLKFNYSNCAKKNLGMSALVPHSQNDMSMNISDGPGLCGIFGKGMVETFDEHMLTINGSCQFKLAADCSEAQDFAIYSEVCTLLIDING